MDYNVLVWLWEVFESECIQRNVLPDYKLFQLWIDVTAPDFASRAREFSRKEYQVAA